MTTETESFVSIFGVEASAFVPHMVHSTEREYRETNCYTDVVVALLHARGDEPLAALSSTVRMDFEGDQWTFFKPFADDLERLFGVDIHEMQPYRSLPDQIADQIALGRTMIVELDAWYLPDTSATAYHREHVKTSVAVEAIDVSAERLRYFHNTGLHHLEGHDYRGVFGLDVRRPEILPPYAEVVRFDAGERLRGPELRGAAREIFQRHLQRRPNSNPFVRFGIALARDLPALLEEEDLQRFHDYAFATVRMAGAGFELCASSVTWLYGNDAAAASGALMRIVTGCKALSFKIARRRPFDAESDVRALSDAWAEAQQRLSEIDP